MFSRVYNEGNTFWLATEGGGFLVYRLDDTGIYRVASRGLTALTYTVNISLGPRITCVAGFSPEVLLLNTQLGTEIGSFQQHLYQSLGAIGNGYLATRSGSIFDLSKPEKPKLVNSVPKVIGYDPKCEDDALYFVTRTGIQKSISRFRVEKDFSYSKTGELPISGTVRTFAVRNSFLYVVTTNGGSVYDPKFIRISNFGPVKADSLVEDKFIFHGNIGYYLVGGDTVYIWDFGDPANPKPLGNLKADGGSDSVQRLSVADRLYTLGYNKSVSQDEVIAYEISEEDYPSKAGVIKFPDFGGYPWQLHPIHPNYLAISINQGTRSRVEIWDFSSPSTPKLKTTHDQWKDWYNGSLFSSPFLYASSGDGALITYLVLPNDHLAYRRSTSQISLYPRSGDTIEATSDLFPPEWKEIGPFGEMTPVNMPTVGKAQFFRLKRSP